MNFRPVPIAPNVTLGGDRLVVIAGPCVIESVNLPVEIAEIAKDICVRAGADYVFKASFDKANRTSGQSFRGPGIGLGLKALEQVKTYCGVPILTDIHEPDQARIAAEIVDVLQIPAFLCRQTDLLKAAVETGKPVNIKKGQFLSPQETDPIIKKALGFDPNAKISLTERGASFGYNNLVVDMRSLPIMRSMGVPVIFDATHSVQRPGGMGTTSGGDREMVFPLLRAACAVGIDGLFLETHPDPENAMSDGPNSLPLDRLEEVIKTAVAIFEVGKRFR